MKTKTLDLPARGIVVRRPRSSQWENCPPYRHPVTHARTLHVPRPWPLVLGLLFAGSPTPGAAEAPPLQRECIARRAARSRGQAGEARFTMDRDDPRFRPRSARLTRRVLCGFVDGKLAKAAEHFYLRLQSADMRNPGFSIGPHLSDRYYLVCEGSLGTTMPAFVAGRVLTFADNTFTLPCTHSVYPTGVYDPNQAHRITGRAGYRMESAVLEVRRGPTIAHPRFDVAIDVVAVNHSNPRETLRLRGRVFGELSTSFTIIDCPTKRRFTKQAPHPACP